MMWWADKNHMVSWSPLLVIFSWPLDYHISYVIAKSVVLSTYQRIPTELSLNTRSLQNRHVDFGKFPNLSSF
ncbi:hypothetical protein BIW11_07751, partial [Tropilaelaps mercedesae]